MEIERICVYNRLKGLYKEGGTEHCTYDQQTSYAHFLQDLHQRIVVLGWKCYEFFRYRAQWNLLTSTIKNEEIFTYLFFNIMSYPICKQKSVQWSKWMCQEKEATSWEHNMKQNVMWAVVLALLLSMIYESCIKTAARIVLNRPKVLSQGHYTF